MSENVGTASKEERYKRFSFFLCLYLFWQGVVTYSVSFLAQVFLVILVVEFSPPNLLFMSLLFMQLLHLWIEPFASIFDRQKITNIPLFFSRGLRNYSKPITVVCSSTPFRQPVVHLRWSVTHKSLVHNKGSKFGFRVVRGLPCHNIFVILHISQVCAFIISRNLYFSNNSV